MKYTAATFTLAGAVAVLAAVALATNTFTGSLFMRPDWAYTKSTGLATITESAGRWLNWTHTSGTGANQMDQLFQATVTLTNSASVTYNLAGGVTNAFGEAITFAEVRVMAVVAGTGNVGNVTVGGAAANAFVTWLGDASDKVSVGPGGVMAVVAPDATAYAVSTNGNVLLTNTGTNTVTCNFYVGGASQ